jgi:hypothetical protein
MMHDAKEALEKLETSLEEAERITWRCTGAGLSNRDTPPTCQHGVRPPSVEIADDRAEFCVVARPTRRLARSLGVAGGPLFSRHKRERHRGGSLERSCKP